MLPEEPWLPTSSCQLNKPQPPEQNTNPEEPKKSHLYVATITSTWEEVAISTDSCVSRGVQYGC